MEWDLLYRTGMFNHCRAFDTLALFTAILLSAAAGQASWFTKTAQRPPQVIDLSCEMYFEENGASSKDIQSKDIQSREAPSILFDVRKAQSEGILNSLSDGERSILFNLDMSGAIVDDRQRVAVILAHRVSLESSNLEAQYVLKAKYLVGARFSPQQWQAMLRSGVASGILHERPEWLTHGPLAIVGRYHPPQRPRSEVRSEFLAEVGALAGVESNPTGQCVAGSYSASTEMEVRPGFFRRVRNRAAVAACVVVGISGLIFTQVTTTEFRTGGNEMSADWSLIAPPVTQTVRVEQPEYMAMRSRPIVIDPPAAYASYRPPVRPTTPASQDHFYYRSGSFRP